MTIIIGYPDESNDCAAMYVSDPNTAGYWFNDNCLTMRKAGICEVAPNAPACPPQCFSSDYTYFASTNACYKVNRV